MVTKYHCNYFFAIKCYQKTIFVFFCFYNANSRQEYFFHIFLFRKVFCAVKKYQFCLHFYQILNLSYQTTLCFFGDFLLPFFQISYIFLILLRLTVTQILWFLQLAGPAWDNMATLGFSLIAHTYHTIKHFDFSNFNRAGKNHII